MPGYPLSSTTAQFPRDAQDGPKGPHSCIEARAHLVGWTKPTGSEHGIWGPTARELAVGSASYADGPRVFYEGDSLRPVECSWGGPGSRQIT